jgi:predicted porin
MNTLQLVVPFVMQYILSVYLIDFRYTKSTTRSIKMKRSSLAVALLATASAAMAQSSVTLFGVIDAGITRISGDTGHRTGLTNSNQSYSRLGFRGTESLGGSLRASFWLEGQLQNDVGLGHDQSTAFTFQRRSTVSLSGDLGEVRLGRDFTPTFWNTTLFDPWGGTGVAGNEMDAMLGNAPGGVNGGQFLRNNNAVSYFLPGNLGGFHGQIQIALGENSSNADTKAGDYKGVRLGYAQDKFSFAFATGEYKTGAGAARGSLKPTNAGGSYDFGVVRMSLALAQERSRSGSASNKQTAWLIGAVAPIGVHELRAAYSSYDRKNSADDYRKLAVGYGHNLSKRTQLYATYARVSNKGAAAVPVGAFGLSSAGLVSAGGNSTGVEMGIRHNF